MNGVRRPGFCRGRPDRVKVTEVPMRKQHPAIVALDTLAGFGSHRAVCKQVRYSPRVTQAYCEDCRRFPGEPINRGNNAYTAMLTHALNTAPETQASEAAKKAVKAAHRGARARTASFGVTGDNGCDPGRARASAERPLTVRYASADHPLRQFRPARGPVLNSAGVRNLSGWGRQPPSPLE